MQVAQKRGVGLRFHACEPRQGDHPFAAQNGVHLLGRQGARNGLGCVKACDLPVTDVVPRQFKADQLKLAQRYLERPPILLGSVWW